MRIKCGVAAVAAGALLACAGAMAHADTIYAVTGTNLVRFDSATPGSFTTIGAHGRTGALVSLTTNQADGLFYSIEYIPLGGNSYQQNLIAISPLTGAAAVTANLGISTDVGFYEAVEYVNSLHTMVISKAPSSNIFNTQFLVACTPSGPGGQLCDTGRDNDVTVYDSRRDSFYGSDPNGFGQFTRFNLGTGGGTDVVGVSANLGDLAYSAQDDVIYAQDYINSQLYAMQPTGSFGSTLIGSFAEPILAMTTVPAPGGVALALGVAAAGLRRKRR